MMKSPDYCYLFLTGRDLFMQSLKPINLGCLGINRYCIKHYKLQYSSSMFDSTFNSNTNVFRVFKTKNNFKTLLNIKKVIVAHKINSIYLMQALWEGKRLDGRGCNDARDVEITYGLDWGSCQVTLGRTRVLAQVRENVDIFHSLVNEGMRQIF